MASVTVSNEEALLFDPELFVDRKEERKLFIETVRARKQKEYLEFNGITGQGKSEFLKWIYYNPQHEKYSSAYIDFELPKYHYPEIYPVLQTITNHLSAKISPEPFRTFKKNLPPYLEELGKFHHDASINLQAADRRPLEKLENSLVETFNNDLNSVLESSKVVLCLDSTEKAYSLTLRALEDQVLKYHTKHQNFMLVTAGQEKVVWKNTEIRNRVKRHELSRLDSEGVHQQVKSLADKKGFGIEDEELISDKMLQLTLGHPFSTYQLVNFWTEGFNEPLEKSIVEERFAQSIQELLKTVVEDRILEKFELGEAYPPVKEILWYLAPLRRIELSTFRYMLSTFLGEWFEGKPFMFFEELMGKFQKTYVFTRWQLGSGFDLDPVVHNILLWDMRVNAPGDFIEVQEKLSNLYANWVKRTRDATQIKNIVERLYHYATYLQYTQPGNINTLVQKDLRRYLESYFTSEFAGSELALRDQLNRLYNELQYDKELADLIDVDILLSVIEEQRDTYKGGE